MLRKVALKGHPPLHIQQPLSDPQGSNQYTQPPGLRPRWALRVPAHRLATRQHRQPNLRAKPTPTPTPGGVMLPASPCGARCPKETPVGGRPGASPCGARFPLATAAPGRCPSPRAWFPSANTNNRHLRCKATKARALRVPCVSPDAVAEKTRPSLNQQPPHPPYSGGEDGASAYPCLAVEKTGNRGVPLRYMPRAA